MKEQIIKYLACGFICATIHFGTATFLCSFALGDMSSNSYTIQSLPIFALANFCGFLLANIVCYFLSCRFVFSFQEIRFGDFYNFVMVAGIGFIAGLLLSSLSLAFDLNIGFANLVLIGFSTIINFVYRKYILFVS